MSADEAERIAADHLLGDAWDEPDTRVPPCLFCRRSVPCDCAGATCMCPSSSRVSAYGEHLDGLVDALPIIMPRWAAR